MNKHTNGRTNEQKSPCVLQDFVPFGAAAQKILTNNAIKMQNKAILAHFWPVTVPESVSNALNEYFRPNSDWIE